ncbi:hypothetical protein BOO71_0001894 [Deinococcus marmoris]|uniref:Uncharacterized protein n=1 Tax=Deinococcus marmoris TaxID=249408 RepID=A0A1U7P3H5_9DEIO|nr:hypothetical protein BOO71_0001894 [Deinococcus marmoris]
MLAKRGQGVLSFSPRAGVLIGLPPQIGSHSIGYVWSTRISTVTD